VLLGFSKQHFVYLLEVHFADIDCLLFAFNGKLLQDYLLVHHHGV
jgi:hypothetical protein